MGITVQADGSFLPTQRFLTRLSQLQVRQILERHGPAGVAALSAATPSESGLTARSWRYRIDQNKGSYSIVWENTNIVKGANVALLIQYGHGTGTGGYVQGRDYVNPAMTAIFEQILADVRRVVKA